MVGQALPRVSQLVVDSDLVIPPAYKLVVKDIWGDPASALYLRDQVGATTLVLLDHLCYVVPGSSIFVDYIQEQTPGGRVKFPQGIKTDTIDDYGGAAISVLEDVEVAATKYLKAPLGRIDALYDQSGAAAASFPAGLNTDAINEYTSAHGIDLNDPVTLDALVTKLTQMYRTGTPSNIQRYIDATEVTIPEPPMGHTFLKGSITIPDNYTGSANGIRLKVKAKKTNSGGIVALRAYINAVDQGPWNNIINAYAEYSIDLSGVAPGDVITVYCYSSQAGGGNVSAKDLKACCDDTIAHVMGSLTW